MPPNVPAVTAQANANTATAQANARSATDGARYKGGMDVRQTDTLPLVEVALRAVARRPTAHLDNPPPVHPNLSVRPVQNHFRLRIKKVRTVQCETKPCGPETEKTAATYSPTVTQYHRRGRA